MKNLFILMAFSKYLREKRKAAGLTQLELANLVTAHGHNVTAGAISNIERAYYKRADGGENQPDRNFVTTLADVLRLDVDEALITAGYAPRSLTQGRPESLPELIAVLERAGITHIEFADADRLQAASPEELRDVIESVSLALEIALARLKRKEAATDAPRPAYPAEQRDRE